MHIATQNERRGFAKQTLHPDLCVVGAGIAGISATLEAAKAGLNVLLIDAAPQLGGQAVSAMIGTFCGMFSNGPDRVQLAYGVADHILHDLKQSQDLRFTNARNTTIVRYRIAALQRWIERAIEASGAPYLLSAVIHSVERSEDRIVSLNVATRFGPIEVAAAAFIDATGDASLAWLAGLEVQTAQKTDIYGTTIFTLEGVALDGLARIGRAGVSALVAAHAAEYGLNRHEGVVVHGFGDEVHVNFNHVRTPLDALGASRTTAEGRDQADRLLALLRAKAPDIFAEARVRTYALPGARQTRCIVGQHQLTADEIRTPPRFEDSILRCAWPIELHNTAEGSYWEMFADDHIHHAPLRALLHREVRNLSAIGRCMSADPVALSSLRVMGACIPMGAAAAHAAALSHNGDFGAVDLVRLKTALEENLAAQSTRFV